MAVLIILWVVLLYLVCRPLWKWAGSNDGRLILLALITTFFILAPPGLLYWIGTGVPRVEVTTHTNVLSIKDNSSHTGSSFFFGGHVGTASAYHYYERGPDGGYELKSIIARGVTVFEDAPEGTGYLEVITSEVQEPGLYLHTTLWSSGYPVSRSIHVPAGSITTDFILDAE